MRLVATIPVAEFTNAMRWRAHLNNMTREDLEQFPFEYAENVKATSKLRTGEKVNLTGGK